MQKVGVICETALFTESLREHETRKVIVGRHVSITSATCPPKNLSDGWNFGTVGIKDDKVISLSGNVPEDVLEGIRRRGFGKNGIGGLDSRGLVEQWEVSSKVVNVEEKPPDDPHR